MSEEGEVIDSTDAPDVETEALALGWSPKEQWRGSEADWVDAETFVERGKHVMPLLKKNNERLVGQLTQTQTQLEKQATELKTLRTTMKLLEEHREADVKAQVEERLAELKQGIAAASRDGDHEQVAELTDQLATERAKLNAPITEVKADDDEPVTPKISPEVITWYGQNPEYVKDVRRRALGDAVALELRQKGEQATGAAFMDLVKDEVEKVFGGNPRTGKVSGGNGGTSRGSQRSGGGKSYADLPPEAKAACDKQGQRLVGAGKAFKDAASWQAQYAKTYFEQE